MMQSKLRKIVIEFLEKYTKTYREGLTEFIEADWKLTKNIEVYVDDFCVVIELPEYYKFIEAGRKPNSTPPPSKAILNWIKVKKIIPRSYNGGKIPTKEQLSYIIARSIGRKGIKPRPFIKPTLEANPFDVELLTERINEEILNNIYKL